MGLEPIFRISHTHGRGGNHPCASEPSGARANGRSLRRVFEGKRGLVSGQVGASGPATACRKPCNTDGTGDQVEPGPALRTHVRRGPGAGCGALRGRPPSTGSLGTRDAPPSAPPGTLRRAGCSACPGTPAPETLFHHSTGR
jgi:hypothetical protein